MMRTNTSHIKQREKGVVLFIALVTASIVLAIGMSILHLTLKDFVLSSAVRESEMAFAAADAGMECALYWQQSTEGRDLASGGAFSPGTHPIKCMGPSTIPVGTNLGTTETFQVSWGTPAMCAKVEVTRDTSATDLSCEVGTCITIISRGYNRGCGQLSGTRVIERALQAQFYEP